ncbi:hypothetical protein Saso_77300 [Streptomyces asoensis]|uniref:Uncharacterized protein n=1 Tax=Streptomyces asoensis TaxID=249586 RepID=A0ABQ3SD63_9ACTN|nr:hypothetical protein Saso_77300 [Streptomyces asoensis]
MTPAKTPVALPFNDPGSIPARSNTSHAVSNNNRCCGSIANASRGEIPKNPASNSPAPSKNPPSRAYDFPTTPGSGSYNLSTSHPRPPGNNDTASPPDATRSHNPSGDPTPPGKRHAIPTIATGSSTPTPPTTERATPADTPAPRPSTSPRTNPANTNGVG